VTSSIYSEEDRTEAQKALIKKCPHNIDYAIGVVERMAITGDLDLVSTARLVASLLPDPPEHRTKITFCYGFDGERCPVHDTPTTNGVCSTCFADTVSEEDQGS